MDRLVLKQVVVDRLAAYEDTGLEPEEVEEALNRLNENIGTAKMWSRKHHELMANK